MAITELVPNVNPDVNNGSRRKFPQTPTARLIAITASPKQSKKPAAGLYSTADHTFQCFVQFLMGFLIIRFRECIQKLLSSKDLLFTCE